MEKTVTAKIRDAEQEWVHLKRKVEMYELDDPQTTSDANKGMILRVQAEMRNNAAQQLGLVTKTADGKEVDLSEFLEV